VRAYFLASAVVVGVVAGCGPSSGIGDMSAPGPDMQAAPLTLTVGGSSRPMRAFYSFYVRPLAEDPAEVGVFLVVTAIDPAFACDGGSGDYDALSFLFGSMVPGTSTSMLLARHGPDLAPTSGGAGYMQLDRVDDRLAGYDLDGGVVAAGMGSVGGRAHFAVGDIVLDGGFTASRCAALDFIIPG
jgi:hypothetical protein